MRYIFILLVSIWVLSFPFVVCCSFIATHVLSSHTLWHLCVFAAVIVWYYQIKQFQNIIYVEGFTCDVK